MNAVLQIKPREMRMMSERIFSLGQMPKGFALTLTDLPMYSQMQGLGGFALMEQRQADFLHADPRALRVAAEAGPDVTFDAAGQHAWVALPSVLDLLGEGCARFGRACVTVIDVKDRKELELAAGLGLRLAHKWLKKWGGNLVVQNRHEGFFRRCAGTEIRISLRRLSS